MKISAIWIAKNEEKNISNSIHSVKNAVDEIIVVDTGSTDHTVDVAQKAGAQMAHYVWNDDFSAARNYALSLASGDIVIFLDADEWFSPGLTPKDRDAIEQMFETYPDLDAIQLCLFHFNHAGDLMYISSARRIFRHHNECHYDGFIHEVLIKKGHKPLNDILLNHWQIHHSGYDPGQTVYKCARNTAILEKAIKNENNPVKRHLYTCYIVRELSSSHQHEKAVGYLAEVLKEARYLSNHLARFEHSFASIIYRMLSTSFAMRKHVSRRELRHKIIDSFKKYLSQYPGAETIGLFFDMVFYPDERNLLNQLDAALIAADRISQVQETSFLAAESELCIKAAQAALLRNDYNTALKYAVQANRRKTEHNPQIIHIMINCMNGAPLNEAVLFLNDYFNINDAGVLKSLTTSVFKMGLKKVYLHYLELLMKTPEATPWDYFFLVLLKYGCKEGVAAAKEYYAEHAAVAAKTIMLAAILADDVQIFNENKTILAGYKDVLDAFFGKKAVETAQDNHADILTEYYPLIAFAADVSRADAFAAVFPQLESFAHMLRFSFCVEHGLFDVALGGLNKHITENDVFVLQIMIRAEWLEAAFLSIKEQLGLGRANGQLFQYLAVIVEKAKGTLRKEASHLYHRYKSVYDKFVDLRDMLNTGYLVYHHDKTQEKSLKTLDYKQLETMQKAPNITGLYSACVDAAAVYEEKAMVAAALDCLMLAYTCDKSRKQTTQIIQSMARLFKKIGNVTLAEILSEKVNLACHEKIEMVFLTYNVSMWDSLESIWLAAKDSPQCDAYVVAIPYYNRLSDGSLGEMQYDGDRYPEDVPIVHWESYRIKERRPHVVFTYYPYDGENSVTSIPSEFFCENLKNHTESLIYIPYFVSPNISDVMEKFAVYPGVLHADYVFVQSEKMRGIYIKAFQKHEDTNHWNGKFGDAEEKFIAAGSPKFDKVLSSMKARFTLPIQWENIVKRDGVQKKIIFYNTTLIGMLYGKAQHLQKIKTVLAFFRHRDDVVLWWRPHPLAEATYHAMMPQFADEYKDIVTWYQQEGFGIYDDTPDLHRAIVLSDGYYGDYSSIFALYRLTGKPILRQNPQLPFEISDAPLETNTFYFYEKKYNDFDMWLNDCVYSNKQRIADEYLNFSDNLIDCLDGTSGQTIYAFVKNKYLSDCFTGEGGRFIDG